ncbi:hypothetical protein CR513_18012, partial [Mucuna pruriens]
MKCMFLEKFFPASRTTTIKKEICGIRQHFGVTLHEYYERFNKICAICSHHQINEQLLIQYFYEGLTMMDRSMIDTASGRALMDKTSVAARHLISNMARVGQPRMVNEIGAVDNLRLENQLTVLTSLVRQLAVGQHQPSLAARVCGICTSMEHHTDMCPMLQETDSDHPESVGAIGGCQYGKQSYQSRAKSRALCGLAIQICSECTSNSKWLSVAESAIPDSTVPTTTTTENATSRHLTIFRRLDKAVISTKHTIQDLKMQIGQLANTMSHLQSARSSNLPSQTILNPRGNASVVTLRSGRELLQITPQQEPRLTDTDS